MITRDDIPDIPEETLVYPDPWHPKLSTDHSYIYSFPEGIPIRFNFRIDGLDSGNSIIVGFCIPLNATSEQIILHGNPKPMQINTYDDLVNDRSGAGYYWDKNVGAIFRRFQVKHVSSDKILWLWLII